MIFKNDSLYCIKFYDHCIGGEVMVCEVAGWVIENNKLNVVISYWRVGNSKEWRDANQEPVSIIKSAIISKRKLR